MKIHDDTNFPIDVGNPFVNFLQKIILWSINGLALLMAIVIVWSVIDVAILIVIKAQNPTLFVTDLEEILAVFGAFLVVLIAIEIFLNIILYLKKNMGHLRLVIATALMAIARKIIILDYKEMRDLQLVGMGAIILALAIAYWLVHQSENIPFPLMSRENEIPKQEI